MRAVIYARYSSANQRDESIEGQLRECKAYAARKGYRVVDEYIDKAMSATTDRRPSFQRMIRDSDRRGFDIVLCYKHDRFARNRYDAAIYKAKLKANDVRIEYSAETMPEGADAIIIDSIMEGFAEYYSANLSQNVKRGLYDSALKRYTLGVRLLGLKEGDDKRFALDEETAPIVRRIYEDYASGKSCVDICAELNAQGIKTAKGAAFTKNSIPVLLKNEKYKGVYRYADIYDENGIPSIVSVELWDKCQALLKARKEAPALSADKGGYLLSGKLFCGECGSSMTAGSGTSKTGAKYLYYTCNGRRGKKGCQMHNVPKAFLEDKVIAILRGVCFSTEIIREYADTYIKIQDEREEQNQIPLLEKRLKHIDNKLANVVDLLVEHPTQVLKDKLVALENEKASVSEEIERLKYEEIPRYTRDEVIFWLKSFRCGDADSPEWRAYIIKAFLARAVLYDDGRLILQLNFAPPYNTLKVASVALSDVTLEAAEQTSVECSNFSKSALPSMPNSNTFRIFFREGFVFVSVVI